jgi:predicted RNA-binding protein with PUA-like domain
MAYWLLKTEPSDYSFDDLVREGKSAWTGVKNALAQKHLRAMKAGDELLIYHTGEVKAVVGTGKVTREAYEDPTDTTGKRVAIDLAPIKRLERPVPLAEIKADKAVKEWALVTIGRLSVVPTTKTQFERILRMATA